jgi:hypothetical protein
MSVVWGQKIVSTDKSNPSIGSVNAVGSGNVNEECVKLRTDGNSEREWTLLVDTGTDVSLLKPDNLDRPLDHDGKI